MRKFFSLLCACILTFVCLSPRAFATEEYDSCKIVEFVDGSYIEIIIEEIAAKATNTKNGNKTYTYYDASNNMEWQAKLSASFTYNGTSSTCTSAGCTVTVYDSKWYEVANSTTRSGNTATTQLTMGEKFWGITIAKPEYTITLTCDKDGNLS